MVGIAGFGEGRLNGGKDEVGDLGIAAWLAGGTEDDCDFGWEVFGHGGGWRELEGYLRWFLSDVLRCPCSAHGMISMCDESLLRK